jgi:TolB protein
MVAYRAETRSTHDAGTPGAADLSSATALGYKPDLRAANRAPRHGRSSRRAAPPWYLVLLAVSIGCAGCGGGGGSAPAGRRIAFVSDRDGHQEIYTMNADGTDQRRLTNSPSNTHNNSPCWSPDHQRLAFVSDGDGSAQIYLMNADGRGLLQLTHGTGPNGGPVWSPDGRRIAYVVGGQSIWVMNGDGSGRVQLTTGSWRDGGPAWSPDGSKIYFVSNRDTGDDRSLLYVMSADGTNQHALGGHLAVDGRPAVSPDGTRIAYASDLTPTEPSLFVVKADGSSPTRVGPENSAEPAWAPDGKTLTFTSWRDGNAQLYSMAANGTQLRRLTRTLATEAGAAW